MTLEAEKTLVELPAENQTGNQKEPRFYTQLFKNVENIDEDYDLLIREILLDHFLPIEMDY